MVRLPVEERTVELPEGVTASYEGGVLTVKGPRGELRRNLAHAGVEIKVSDGKVIVRREWAGKRERSMIGTVAAHIKNMALGVSRGFTYKLKIVSSHFPITVKVSDGKVHIENFIGERRPRTAKIVGNAQVKVEGEDVIVQGISLEDVSQTAANIQQATKIRKKDPRVFLDGIYIYEKTVGGQA
ncbi:MAG: 50S ribosomal protein L6 [Candidatus Hecatellaceae archaeon]|nr:MAG: 50S ribosomal protein L6 [Candidatus Hecatellales archaeon]